MPRFNFAPGTISQPLTGKNESSFICSPGSVLTLGWVMDPQLIRPEGNSRAGEPSARAEHDSRRHEPQDEERSAALHLGAVEPPPLPGFTGSALYSKGP